MFEFVVDGELPPEAFVDDSWCGIDIDRLIRLDPLAGVEVPDNGPDRPNGMSAPDQPSGWLALELDVATDDPARLGDAGLIDAIVEFDRMTSWAAARQARLLAEFARRRPVDAPEAANCDRPSIASRFAPDEIGLALHLSRGTAIARLGQAVRLERVLPATLEAWERGRIDALKVRSICDVTRVLDDDKATQVQDRVLPKAAGQTVAQLRAALARAVLAVDAEGAAARHKEARKDRRVSVGQENEGMASLWALLPAPGALSAYEWLTRLARGLGKDDPRGMDARRADLMVELLTGRLTIAAPTGGSTAAETAAAGTAATTTATDCAPTDCAPTDCAPTDCAPTDCAAGADRGEGSGGDCDGDRCTGCGGNDFRSGSGDGVEGCCSPTWSPRPATPGKPLVQVVMPYSTLTGADDQPCELVGYGAIPADLAREIAADAVWKRLVTDPLSGALLDHGRTTYRPPAALSDFVRARDVYCRFPPCRGRAIDTELDHTIAYRTADGATADTNLYGGCVLHHHLKHDAPGWSVVQEPDGRITWTTPTGHRYTSDPYDYRPEPEPPTRPAAHPTAAGGSPVRRVFDMAAQLGRPLDDDDGDDDYDGDGDDTPAF